MILVHGELGSGRSRVLRDLETRPPDGYRGIYVPVPTLDLADLARWCLDRLGRTASADPLAVLAREPRLVLLVDDAERLPPATAAGLHALERDALGTLTVVAACESGAASAPAVAALGVPTLSLRLGAGSTSPVEAAERVREALGPRRVVQAPAPPRPAAARPTATAAQRIEPSAPPAQPASGPVVVQRPSAAPARPRAAAPPASAAIAAKPPRMIPLWLATVIGVAAFLVPVAFLAGFLVASGWIGARSRALPDVAAAPSSAREAAPRAKAPAAESAARAVRSPTTEESPGEATRSAPEVIALAAALPTHAPTQERGAGPPFDPRPTPALGPSPPEDTGTGPAPTLLRVGPPPR